MKTSLPRLAFLPDPAPRLDRLISIYAEAAGLEPERVRRWAQLQVVDLIVWEQRHGLPITRDGMRPDRIIALACQAAGLLLPRSHG